MPHTCPHCDKVFSQKGHLDKHLNKKKTCEKCNLNFTSQYAYINGKYIHVKDYQRNKGDKIKCARGHELVLCDGEKIIKYFRHKNTDDIGGKPMTEWHSRMQSYFPVTEFRLKKLDKQIKERRADVLVENHNCIIEFEHSGKTIDEVICKAKDCLLHDKNIIWFIDGNTKDTKIEHLSTDNFLITFEDDWKYKSFVHNYEFVLLDIDDQIFKIPVKKVCNKMILVKEWKPIEYVMNILKIEPNNIWNKWEDDNEIQAKLLVQQKGAGNGKTFGIWKSIAHNHDKELFIIVTKQHSAKTVIMKELNDQAERNEYHIIDNMSETEKCDNARKYIIKYKHNYSDRNCIVIISTIDALMFNISENKVTNSNYFEGLLESIIEYGTEKVNKLNGSFKYAGQTLCLNKKSELWIDEAQDLHEKYFKAIIKLMLATKIDTIIVGDKLQSLEHKINFMTCVDENVPNINLVRETPVNDNRRIKIHGMAQEINNLIKFKKHNLPEISVNNPEKLIPNEERTIEIIDIHVDNRIYAGVNSDKNKQNINVHIDDIINRVDKEVNLHNYLPEDFLFIFPLMKSNLIVGELETRLNEYWINRKEETETYEQYAVLHKHEEGQVIDTSLSDKACRIVTIRTSKGDGRKVVFVLGPCTEQILKLVSRSDNIDLIYESYLHVALTRAKNKIYFALEKNNDEIHQRFSTQGLVEYCPDISSLLSHDKILDFIDKEKVIVLLKNNDIEEPPSDKKNDVNANQPIDWEYHCIRRAVYLQYAIFNIFKHNKCKKSFNSSQIKTILNALSKLNVCITTPIQFYKYLHDTTKDDTNLEYIPVCKLSHKRQIYRKYANQIKTIIEKNKNQYIDDPMTLVNFKPVEAVIQWYTIELYRRKKYCETTPATIYNIINHFKHDDETKITELLRESENIKETTTTAMNDILNNNNDDDVGWNIEHMIKMNGETNNFEIWFSNIPIIGYSDNTTYHLIFQTDFNELNFWDTMIKILVERFIICNTGDKGNDTEKFFNKRIITYLFILKQNRYEKYDWDWHSSKENTLSLKKLFKNAVVKYYSTYNTMLFNYCKFLKQNKVKWSETHKSPYHYISYKYTHVIYIRDFFIGLHERSKEDRAYVKKLTDNYDSFCENLTERIEDMCNSFLGLNEIIDEGGEW